MADDLLVLVLDCVRADAVSEDEPRAARMPNLREIEREATVFPRALATSQWTLPTHASVLTGLPPWEHRTFRGSTLTLPVSVPTYAERFAARGFRTACFSANPFVSPWTGVVRGFLRAEWGQFSDCFRRFQTRPRPVGIATSTARDEPPSDGLSDRGLATTARDSVRRLVTRLPFPWELATRLARGSPAGGLPYPRVAGWIETDLRQHLADTPADQSTFTFVNLLDAHEPYFGVLLNGGTEIPDWVWAYSGPLDRTAWREHRAVPDARDVARIQRLYRAALECLDSRIGALLEIYREERSAVDPSVVILGDHGQALGESGRMYHVEGVTNATLRVPMMIRSGEPIGPARQDEWTMVTDAFRWLARLDPTYRFLAGPDQRRTPEATSCPAALVDQPPPSTRLLRRYVHPTPGSRPEPAVVAFSGSIKLMRWVRSGETAICSAESDDPEVDRVGDGAPIRAEVARIAALVRGCLDSGDTQAQEARLASWGY